MDGPTPTFTPVFYVNGGNIYQSDIVYESGQPAFTDWYIKDSIYIGDPSRPPEPTPFNLQPNILNSSVLLDPTQIFYIEGDNRCCFYYLGYTFVNWNSMPDGSGTSYEVGDTCTLGATYYAIWAKAETPNLTISYKGSAIKSLSSSEHFELTTAGKYLEDDLLFNIEFPTLDTSDATVTASRMRAGKTAYGASGKITGSIPNFDGSVTVATR